MALLALFSMFVYSVYMRIDVKNDIIIVPCLSLLFTVLLPLLRFSLTSCPADSGTPRCLASWPVHDMMPQRQTLQGLPSTLHHKKTYFASYTLECSHFVYYFWWWSEWYNDHFAIWHDPAVYCSRDFRKAHAWPMQLCPNVRTCSRSSLSTVGITVVSWIRTVRSSRRGRGRARVEKRDRGARDLRHS